MLVMSWACPGPSVSDAARMQSTDRITNLLVGHELYQVSVRLGQTSLLKLFDSELLKAIVEKIELNVFLVEGKGKREPVEIRKGLVHRNVGTVDIYAAGGRVRHWLRGGQVSGVWIWVYGFRWVSRWDHSG
jgi:hypothetical protein